MKVVLGDTPALPTPRQVEPAWRLVLRTLGGPRAVAGKLVRLARAFRMYVDFAETQRRIDRLQVHLSLPRMPTRLQMWFGGLDMLRFLIVPAAAEYYRMRGINFRFHQLLRALDDPASLVDPVGICSERDVAIGHLMQVVHLNPRYDVQLLGMFPDGVSQLEDQLRQMIAGIHPRAASIGAIVEHPDYHRQLLAYVEGYQRDPRSVEMVRADAGLRADPEFALAEAQFSALDDFLRYAVHLPTGFFALLRHRFGTPRLCREWCDRDPLRPG
jgi:hypothetical protein